MPIQSRCNGGNGMNRKVKAISTGLAEKIMQWDGVDAVTLAESAEEDVFDPYFFISLDVHYAGTLPKPAFREKIFEANLFESSSVQNKDRFFVREMPVRVEYKQKSDTEKMIARKEQHLDMFRASGTYIFYRLENGSVLSKKSDWIDSIRQQLRSFPESFWNSLRIIFQTTMEHKLGDLGAAAFRKDDFFYLVSSSGFVRNVCRVLFSINRVFEPSGRLYYKKVTSLPRLPEEFIGRLDSLLRQKDMLSQERKWEVAELLAKSIIALS